MLSGREGSSAEMIGRSPALQRLCDLVEAGEIASCDRPEVGIVAGAAGIGKTRLFRELVDQVPTGTTVFTMSARPGSVGRAHDTIMTTMRRSDPAAPFAPFAPFAGGTARGIAGAIDGHDGADDPGDAVFAAVAAVVERGPVVVIVEDVHWIDAASALAVDRLAQQPWPRSVFMASYRPDDLTPGSPGGQLVDRLERRHDVEHVRLEPLVRSEVGALVAAIRGGPASSAVIEALHRRSGGVPFVVEELLRCCGPDSVAGDTTAGDVLSAALPWSLDEAVRQQIAGFAAAERTVLDVLAVLGGPAPFDLLAEVARLDEDAGVAALRTLVGAGVVVESADDVFWFAHALMAEAVDAQLLGRERRRLHERCAEVLGRDPDADPAALARHALGAGRFDEVAGIARAGASRYLTQGASFQALRLAAQGLDEVPDDPVLLEVATDAAWRLGFLDEAVCHARRWAEVVTEALPTVESLKYLGRLGVEVGDPDTTASACAALERVTDIASATGDRRVEGRALAALAQVQMIGDAPDLAVAAADRALAIADAIGDPTTAARASVERASALVRVGAPADAVTTALRHAVGLARDDADPVLLARALNNLIDQLPARGEESAARRAELAAVSRSGGVDLLVFGGVHWWEAEAARASGDLAAYRRSINDARPWWRAHGDDTLMSLADARLAHEEGRHADAVRAVARVVSSKPGRVAQIRPFEIVTALAAGDHVTGRALFAELVTAGAPFDTPNMPDEVLALVDALLAAGVASDEVARDVFDRWLAGHPSAAALRAMAEGLLLAATERHEEAVAALRGLLDDPDPALTVPWLGSLRTTLASSLLALGERDAARAEIRHALDHELAHWPGVRRDRAAQLARRLEGAGPRTPDGELTQREREVATLLVEGITNAQLAERLYISPKTAAVHVSNILAKLGLTSRAEIAAFAVRSGLDRQTA